MDEEQSKLLPPSVAMFAATSNDVLNMFEGVGSGWDSPCG